MEGGGGRDKKRMVTLTTGVTEYFPAIDIGRNCFDRGVNVASFYKKENTNIKMNHSLRI
ncbi:hypothetical protein GCM10008931_21250 [Oceanobacillus oncorhynchi subsp. oncorhynchi]